MTQLSGWMGAGVLVAGVSAAMIAGADVAGADTGATSSESGTSSKSSDDAGKPSKSDRADRVGATTGSGGADRADRPDRSDRTDRTDRTDRSGRADAADRAERGDRSERFGKRARGSRDAEPADTGAEGADVDSAGPAPEVTKDRTEIVRESIDRESAVRSQPEPEAVTEVQPEAVTEVQPETVVDSDIVPDPASADLGAKRAPVDRPVKARLIAGDLQAPGAALSPISAAAFTPRLPSLRELPPLPAPIQSFLFEVIGFAVKLISGPPVVHPGSNVTVRSSTLEIADGRTVRADWYYPEGDVPPERIIYLQHGFLGIGPMYSYTASYLAQSTNSIVVAPTLSSNRFVKDGFWLGDDQVYRATADLFLGDREALTASAVAAGFVRKYGTDAALPDSFVLVGHSLGAGVAAGAAGYYADSVIASGADNHLAGVVLLDGAPPSSSLPDALDKLDGLSSYIPVLELGAPKPNRRVDAALNEHRPGYFNGVVLDNGKHLDAMQGGTPLIQFVSYLYQGFPTEQNKSAAQTLIAGWIDDIFAGRIDATTGKCEVDCSGIYGEAGDALVIDTPKGPASGVVIGAQVSPAVAEFAPTPVTALVRAVAPAGKAVLLRV